MTHPIKHLESALPALKGTPAEIPAACAVTLLLSRHSALIAVTNIELGLIAQAMGVSVETDHAEHCATHTVTVEDDGVGVVFQNVQGR
jgi:GMP synthase-like glutamine amidotransferase